MQRYLCVMAMLAVLAGSSMGANYFFRTDAPGDDVSWSDLGNWKSPTLATAATVLPTNADTVWIGHGAATPGMVIGNGVTGYAAILYGSGNQAPASSYDLTIQSGGKLEVTTTYYVNTHRNNNPVSVVTVQTGAELTLTDGTGMIVVALGGGGSGTEVGKGTLVVNGGTVTARTIRVTDTITTAVGHVQLNAGTIRLLWNSANGYLTMGSGQASFDITGGTLILQGPADRDYSFLATYIADGKLTGYGDPAKVVYSYDAGIGAMVVTALTPDMAFVGTGQGGAGDGVSWEQTQNWWIPSMGVPATLPGVTSTVWLGWSHPVNAVIHSGTNAVVEAISGHGDPSATNSNYSLTIEAGASLTPAVETKLSIGAGATGILNVEGFLDQRGGTKVIELADYGNGRMNVTGGLVEAGGIVVARQTGSAGHIQLDAGTINLRGSGIGYLLMGGWPDINGTCSIDITGGMLRLYGPQAGINSFLGHYIGTGQITGYGDRAKVVKTWRAAIGAWEVTAVPVIPRTLEFVGTNYSGGGDGISWDQLQNWWVPTMMSTPTELPVYADTVCMGWGYDVPGVVINNGVNAALSVFLGVAGAAPKTYDLTIASGGSLTIDNIAYLALVDAQTPAENDATWTVNGTVTAKNNLGIIQLANAAGSSSTLNVNGGTIDAKVIWGAAGAATQGENAKPEAKARINLNAGQIHLSGSPTYFPLGLGASTNMLGDTVMNITGGTMYLYASAQWSREQIEAILDLNIADGQLVGNGGAGAVGYWFDPNLGDMGAVVVKACTAMPEADLTGDCKVGVEDLSLLISEWLLDANIPISWEATMDADPVLSGNWALRSEATGNYTISDGKMIIAEHDGSAPAVVDNYPRMLLDEPFEITATFRTTTLTPAPEMITDAKATSIWAQMDTNQTTYGNVRFSVYKTMEDEQVLAVVSANTTLLGTFTGFGDGMITINAQIVPNGTGGVITLDATDGVTTYTDQVINYTNQHSGGPTDVAVVSLSGLGYAGEIDYLKINATQPILYNVGGDPDKVNLEDFAVLASEWLVNNVIN